MLVTPLYKQLLCFALVFVLIEGITSVGRRDRRSPFKKHRIVIDGGSSGEWDQAPAPPPPPPDSEETVVNHHHSTVVEHHHHHHVHVPPPPPPPQHQGGGFRIEINKGKGKGGKGEKDEEIKKAIEDAHGAFEEAHEAFEDDKKKKFEQWKGNMDETIDFFSKLPEKFASDVDLIGSKIKDDLEKKKKEEENKNKGISIQIWKGKGKGGHREREQEHRGDSTEVVHHHHYHGSSEEAYRPRPTQPPPPRKSYTDTYETVDKFGGGLLSFLDQASSHFRAPVAEEGYSDESAGYGHGGKGKGFQFRVWKGGRR